MPADVQPSGSHNFQNSRTVGELLPRPLESVVQRHS
jgi:hypothetical protein